MEKALQINGTDILACPQCNELLYDEGCKGNKVTFHCKNMHCNNENIYFSNGELVQAPPKEPAQCSNCRYVSYDSKKEKQFCRRYPPTTQYRDIPGNITTCYPTVVNTWWCGEYKPQTT